MAGKAWMKIKEALEEKREMKAAWP